MQLVQSQVVVITQQRKPQLIANDPKYIVWHEILAGVKCIFDGFTISDCFSKIGGL